MRVVHLDERRVARVDGQAHADERLEPVGVGRALGAHHESNEIKIKINNKQIINNKQTTNRKEPADVWMYSVFSTGPSSRPRKTTSNVVLPDGGITC